LSIKNFVAIKLLDVSSQYLKACIIIAFNTGMRTGELRLLKWQYIDNDNELIRLPANITKEGRPESVPMNHHDMVSQDDSLEGAMDQYTRWIDDQIANVDQTVDQEAKIG